MYYKLLVFTLLVSFFEMKPCCLHKIIRNPKLCVTNFKKNPCCGPLLYTLSKPIIPTKQSINDIRDITDKNHIYTQFSYRITASGGTKTEVQKLQLLNNTGNIKNILTSYNNKIDDIIAELKTNQGAGQYYAFFKILLLEYNETIQQFDKISLNWFRFIFSFNTSEGIDNGTNIDFLTNNLIDYINSVDKKIYSLLFVDIDGNNGFNFGFSFQNYDVFNYNLNFSDTNSNDIFMNSIPGNISNNQLINFNTQRHISNPYNYQTVFIQGIISNTLKPEGITIFVNSGIIYVGPGDGSGNWLKNDLNNVSKNVLINNNFTHMFYYNLNGSTLSEITTQPNYMEFKSIQLN